MTEQEELELLKQNSPYALPDDPSASGWSTDQIKKKFYSGLVILYNFFKQSRNTQNSMIQAMQELVNEINASYSAITSQETILKVKYDMDDNEIVNTYAKLLDIANGTVAACKYITEDGTSKKYIYELENALATLTTNFNLVKEWADNIKSATSQEAVQRAVSATKDSLGNIIKDTYATVGSFSTVANNIANIIDGTTIVGKAYKDQNGNLIDTYYAKESDMTEVKGKIPNNASPNNQLADKDFVNSSIATATATYRGSYNLVSDLSLTTSASQSDIATALGTTIATADNNDYCYVRIPVANDNTTTISRVDRYKNNGTVWTFEYTLNNSGYTSEQWSAINSGITSALVNAIGLNTDARHTHSNKALLDTYTQTETDLADAVSKKHSHSNKSILDQITQDVVDNEHTHSNKTVLDGITEEDINNIPKSLYHLGAFDTISGNTITRQTGYAYGKDYMDKTILRNSANSPYINTYISVNALDKFVGNCPKVDSNSWWSVTFTTPTLTYDSNGNTLIVMLPNGATDTSALQDIQIQYKLATPYTEQVIEGESILPLDSNMAQMIRQDVVDSLNTFDFDIFNKKEFTTSGNTQKEFQLEVWNDKNYTSYECVFNIFSSDESKTKTISTSKIYYCRLGYSGNVQDDKTDLIPIYLEKGTYTLSGVFTTFELNHIVYKTLMLSKGTNAYPPSDYHASKHITDEEAMLLKEEYKKSSNLYNPTTQVNGYYIDENYTEHANNLYCYNKIPVKPNTTYYMGNFQDVSLHYCHLSSNGSYLRGGYLAKNSAFTTPSDTYYLVISPRQTDNIMLNEGTHAYPYQEYNGDIVHKVDIEPVLLWENSSPNSAFAGQTITLNQSRANFKYTVIKFLGETDNQYTLKIFNEGYTVTSLFYVQGVSGLYIKNRYATFNSDNTTVIFENGYQYDATGGTRSQENSACIPLAIYGTNVL